MTTAYVTYAYYTGTYLGTAIASADFNALALRASAVIDQITFDRVFAIITAASDLDTIDLIKMATCAVAEELQNQSRGGGDSITNESIGSHSVTYSPTSRASKPSTLKCIEAAKLYLGNTYELLYRGIDDSEDYDDAL